MKMKTNRFLRAIVLTAALAAGTLTASTARADWFICTPDQVGDWTNGTRVLVRCSNTITLNGNVVRFLMLSTTDQARANRFITLAQSALLSNKRFSADVPVSSTTNVSGCNAGDCRTPVSFNIIP
jgi:hypothetical protein